MATAGGPKIVTDGLVFGYDTNYGVADNVTGTRFYPGKAVDNEFYNSGPDGTMLDYVGYGGTGTARSGVLDALGTTDNIVYLKTGKLRFGPTGGDDIGTLYYGNTYTFSIYMRHVPGYTQMSGGEFDINDQSSGGKNYSGTLSSNMTYEWKRFSVTSTHTNSSNYHFIDIGTYQGTGVFEWCCPQIELGTIASPFTSTERSNTASLIDLKKTTDISMSNVSFDSTGQPTFDGTDDLINLDSYASIIPVGGSITIDSMVLWDDLVANSVAVSYGGNQTGSGFLFQYEGTAGLEFVLFDGNGNSGRAKILAANSTQYLDKYIHMVGTYDGSTVLLYINGVQAATASYTNGYPTQSYFRIGNEYNRSYFANIDLSVLKIYNKTLSAAEVKQNYNAYKNRFDI